MGVNRTKAPVVSVLLTIICYWLLVSTALADSRGISVIGDLSHQSGKLGAYRALIIGINDYEDPGIPDLETAANDARAMATLLRERYGFRVDLLLNRDATKEAMYRALRKLASTTANDDSVLIYYAGHGDLDRTYDDGWWIPSDAKGGNPITYLDNVQVQKSMRSMRARHVLLISDSCYSGTLFGRARAMPQVIDDKYYLNLYNEKSRWGMTSGNKTPVSDRGTEGHSVFAYQLLKELRRNEKPYISTQELYTRIAPVVGNNSEQTPLCRPIRNTGGQGGEFVFVASGGRFTGISAENKRIDAELAAERRRLEEERRELEKIRAEIEERKELEAERRRLQAEHGQIKAEKQEIAKGYKESGRPGLKSQKPPSEPLASASQTVVPVRSDALLNLALFPFCKSSLGGMDPSAEEKFVDFVVDYTRSIPNVAFTHSYYAAKKPALQKLISIKQTISDGAEKEMWFGDSRYPKKKPDFETLSRLSKSINSNLVLTFKVIHLPSVNERDFIEYKGYLVDIEKNAYYEKRLEIEDFPSIDVNRLQNITKSLFTSYLKSNP